MSGFRSVPGRIGGFISSAGGSRTGDPAEYGIAFGVVAVCAAFFIVLGASGWYPFFYDWAGLYNTGIIDGAEWRANRFRFF